MRVHSGLTLPSSVVIAWVIVAGSHLGDCGIPDARPLSLSGSDLLCERSTRVSIGRACFCRLRSRLAQGNICTHIGVRTTQAAANDK